MDNDAEWVEEVRRWYAAGQRRAEIDALQPPANRAADSGFAVGYEAAHPALQSAHWPDAPASGFGVSGFTSLG